MMPKMVKKFLNPKTVWEVFLSHGLADAEVGRGRGGETPYCKMLKRGKITFLGEEFTMRQIGVYWVQVKVPIRSLYEVEDFVRRL